MKKRSIVWIVVLVIISIVVAVGVYMWNKPHEKVEDREGMKVSIEQLSSDYSSNESAANAKYLNKALEVQGNVTEVKKNQDGQTVVFLQDDAAMTGVQCTMRENDVQVSAGQTVTVKGFCSGNTMFDVLLTDCVVQ